MFYASQRQNHASRPPSCPAGIAKSLRDGFQRDPAPQVEMDRFETEQKKSRHFRRLK
jgi:hypothetical protein